MGAGQFQERAFLTDDPILSVILGADHRPVVGILSYVCPVGNVPLAAVLWGGGISFRRGGRVQ